MNIDLPIDLQFFWFLSNIIFIPIMQVISKEDKHLPTHITIEDNAQFIVDSALAILSKLNFKRQNCRLELDSQEGQ